ncbi:16S rRNA (guanine(527)-N(7))-methyltransferase RsmG [Leucobacter sp. OH2974_COT-288]|uniref:Ribosomal RNA small subunit methyltransferase G n=1 Tax=Canibacter oris TaxID=1365628 RepID=A0A840DDM4_9MICO|nr:16S rRNA (guanine(527)-N(7))-methyltransferase RsmG [Canibacter oris]MBB4071154.1 16S rRNA (guanine527-N7)-methyltransferase [Canibacter oris]MBB4072120.1 16S rRNA (guanine527-N7)-methyltransferase [Canibacter oris]RRD35583.1 16S rRNA (guanine(527)-N(7))-methyltransferase RsmG [Leucobacter sp. OH2974_COT-288]
MSTKETQQVVVREPEPEFLDEFAGDNADKLRDFAADLFDRGETLGLIGPHEPARLWTRHIINSGLLAPLLEPNSKLADIGSGGGFPGIVLAAMRPDVAIRLIEPMERRCAWLQEQVERLGLDNAEVLRGRVEEYHGAFEVDQVTARAVTALKKLVPWTAPLLVPGGKMLFLKGAGVHDEIITAAKVLKKHRVVNYSVSVLGEGLTEPTRVFRGEIAA